MFDKVRVYKVSGCEGRDRVPEGALCNDRGGTGIIPIEWVNGLKGTF